MNKDSNETENNFPYYCQTCDYGCRYPAHWKQHCESKRHLNDGQRQSRSDKKFTGQCDQCSFNTYQPTNLKLHYLNHHAGQDERKKEFKYYCQSCDYGSFVKRLYQIHLDTKHHS